MCGRFAHPAEFDPFYDYFPEMIVEVETGTVRSNVAPTQWVPTLLRESDGRTRLIPATWGLVPRWVKDPKSRPFNARAETLGEKPFFRDAYRTRRCLILANGFYEWKAIPGQKRKQPMFFTLNGGEMFAFAGLWESHPQWGLTSTIITTEPNALVAPIHNRMPVILRSEDYERWLEPKKPGSDELLRPYSAEEMVVREAVL